MTCRTAGGVSANMSQVPMARGLLLFALTVSKLSCDCLIRRVDLKGIITRVAPLSSSDLPATSL